MFPYFAVLQITRLTLSYKLEIVLKEVEEEKVGLKSLSADALDSFIKVLSNLKALATNSVSENNVTFSIYEGSASCAAESSPDVMERIYHDMEIAIQGESYDKELTTSLREIQTQIKRTTFRYQFNYIKDKSIINVDERLSNARQIRLKSSENNYEYKIKILSGLLNEIGGKTPNYRFDYGANEKITIGCTREEAQTVNKYLYKNIHSIVLCKEFNNDKNDQYTHKAIVEKECASLLQAHFTSYYEEKNFVNRLSLIYDFIDDVFAKDRDLGFEILQKLLIAYNDKNLHQSELKTLLVISKPFKEHDLIKEVRSLLLETYQKKRNA